ncbi:MAG: hypothetical protein QOJ04_6960 [Caballeronia sp.]|nr:hypothetical protein [Caballeronia sp.]
MEAANFAGSRLACLNFTEYIREYRVAWKSSTTCKYGPVYQDSSTVALCSMVGADSSRPLTF